MQKDQAVMVSKRTEDAVLRLAGVVTLAVATGSGRLLWLTTPHQSGPPHKLSSYLLALVAFLCASMGAALLFSGRQLKQHIVVSDRWATPADFRHWPVIESAAGQTKN
jgi:hypothetical protein